MMRYKSIGIYLFLIMFVSCKKEQPEPSLFDGGNAVVLGEWNWLETQYYDCAEGWDTLTPENTGDNYSFKLTADTQIVFLQNDTELSTFKLTYRLFELQHTGYVPELRQVVLEMTYIENDSIRDYWIDGRLGKAACRGFPFTSNACIIRYNLFEKVF